MVIKMAVARTVNILSDVSFRITLRLTVMASLISSLVSRLASNLFKVVHTDSLSGCLPIS